MDGMDANAISDSTLTDGQRREIYNWIERYDPELWSKCYPRIYREPGHCGSYYSPKEWPREMFSIALKFRSGLIGQSEQYEFLVASQSTYYKVPTYWIAKDMATAIRQTRAPVEIDWYNMHLPFEACTFMLPKGSLVHPEEGDISYIGYARLKAGEEKISPIVKGERYCSLNGAMTFVAKTTQGGHLLHWNMPLDAYGSKLKIPDLDDIFYKHIGKQYEHRSGWFYQATMTDSDNDLLLASIHYCFNAILLMVQRPDLVTKGALEKRVVAKGKLPKEFWSPNILGERYRIKHEHDPNAPHGTHASPIGHWVRGYYREQHYGIKNSLSKILWIEPLWRGSTPEE